MPVKKSDYETSLAQYSNQEEAIALLKKYRPYLELIPSMRRPDESVIAIPLPIVRLRQAISAGSHNNSFTSVQGATCLPCDLGILMCDPEWKIKTGVEIFVFIHRPQEDFSDLLSRWRQTQILLDKDYEWLMPHRYKHILSDGANRIYPLFVVFPETPDHIQQGLLAASLPCVVQIPPPLNEQESLETLSAESPPA